MENHWIIQDLMYRINKHEEIYFIDEEEYYFFLGQALVAIFVKLGGLNKYRNEFNYLTNPYLPIPINVMAKRILRFLHKSTTKLPISNTTLESIIAALFLLEDQFVNENIDASKAEIGFYKGLHRDSLFNS